MCHKLAVPHGTLSRNKMKRLAMQAAMPVIGFLSSTSPNTYAAFLGAFHQGLNEGGYVAGRNVVIEFRWAEGQYDRLPMLAAD